MNPLRETFHLLYASRLTREEPHPEFSALAGTTIIGFVNVLVVVMLSAPFTGIFGGLQRQGVLAIVAVACTMLAIGVTQYFCWIGNGKLERLHAHIVGAAPMRRLLVFSYIAISTLAIPLVGILEHQLRD